MFRVTWSRSSRYVAKCIDRETAYMGYRQLWAHLFLKRNFKILQKHSIISVWLNCLTLSKFPTAYQVLNQTPYKWLTMFQANTIYEHSLESMSACKRLWRYYGINYGINYVQLSTRVRLTKMLPALVFTWSSLGSNANDG